MVASHPERGGIACQNWEGMDWTGEQGEPEARRKPRHKGRLIV